jgi:hypothetical protein
VVWALDRLARAEAVTLTRDWMPVATRLVELYAEEPDGGEDLGGVVPSLWIGEAGILLVAHQLSPRVTYEQHLMTAIRANIDNPTWELMWGFAGDDVGRSVHVRAHGRRRLGRSLARVRGEAMGGMARRSLVARGDLLDPRYRAELERRAVEVICTYAQREDGLAQWPMSLEPRAGKSSDIRTQWCHELTWRAGPLLKGAGLCHGTAGNGYAFLKLFERTGDERWLARARKFTVHAVKQVERARQEYGQARNTLWTGDIGTAIYLLNCCNADPSMPTLDVF